MNLLSECCLYRKVGKRFLPNQKITEYRKTKKLSVTFSRNLIQYTNNHHRGVL